MMTKKQIAEWLRSVVLVERSPAGIFIEGFCLSPEDFKKLLELLEQEETVIKGIL